MFDAFKKEKAEHKAKSEEDSDEEPQTCEVYFKNTMVYNANRLYPHKAQISNEFNSSAVSIKGIVACHGYSLKKILMHLICIHSLIEQIPWEQG